MNSLRLFARGPLYIYITHYWFQLFRWTSGQTRRHISDDSLDLSLRFRARFFATQYLRPRSEVPKSLLKQQGLEHNIKISHLTQCQSSVAVLGFLAKSFSKTQWPIHCMPLTTLLYRLLAQAWRRSIPLHSRLMCEVIYIDRGLLLATALSIEK